MPAAGVFARLHVFFAPSPPLKVEFASDDELRQTRHYWRVRQLYTTFVGYATFYFVRNNFAMAMPDMARTLGFSKSRLGLFITLRDVVYGISKFLNGMLADRANARWFMALGLLLCALCNVAFGLVTLPIVMGTLIIFNGWFQGMGFPPCARVLSYWFTPRERGTMWGLWNTSHQVGGAGISILGGYLAARYGWRAVFLAPAAIALATSVFVAVSLRDTPASVGLPEEEPPAAAPKTEKPEGFDHLLWSRVFSNPFIWLICVANFFVYVIRYVFVNWTPIYLAQAKGVDISSAGWVIAGFEGAGIAGSLIAGWCTDRFFRARRAPVCIAYMLATIAAIGYLWALPSGASKLAVYTTLLSVGFLIYGPQFLVGVMTADIVGKEAAATAIGLTGFFGYLSGVISGYGMGWIIDTYSWEGFFRVLMGCSIAGTVCFALCWNAAARTTGPPGGDA